MDTDKTKMQQDVKTYFKVHGKLDYSIEHLNAALFAAIPRKDPDAIKRLLGKNPANVKRSLNLKGKGEPNEVQEIEDHYNTILLQAIDNGHSIEIIEALLTGGADVNGKDGHDNTPLHASVWKQKLDIASLLIKKGAEVNAQDVLEQTPLDVALGDLYSASEKDKKMIALLLKSGADPSIENEDGIRLIDVIASSDDPEYQEMIQPLQARVLLQDSDASAPEGMTPENTLKWEQYREELKTMKDLTLADSSGNVYPLGDILKEKDLGSVLTKMECDEAGFMSLLETPGIANGLPHLKDHLKDYLKAKLTISTHFGSLTDEVEKADRPILLEAINEGQSIKEIECLLRSGADVNGKDEEGNTALDASVWKQKPNIASLLIKNGAEVNAQDSSGCTPLHSVCKKYDGDAADREMIELFLQYGADPFKQDEDGTTPIDLIASIESSKHQEMAQRILARVLLKDPEERELPEGMTGANNDKWTEYGKALEKMKEEGISLADSSGNVYPLYDILKEKDLSSVLTKMGCDEAGFMSLLEAPGVADRLPHLKSHLKNYLKEKLSISTHERQIKQDCGKYEELDRQLDESPELFENFLRNIPEQLDKIDISLLRRAISCRQDKKVIDPKVIDSVLKKVADINEKDGSGGTLVHEAARAGQLETLSLLLEKGADAAATDNEGRTPYEAARAQLDTLSLKKDADAAAKDNKGSTPIDRIASDDDYVTKMTQLLKVLEVHVVFDNPEAKIPDRMPPENDELISLRKEAKAIKEIHKDSLQGISLSDLYKKENFSNKDIQDLVKTIKYANSTGPGHDTKKQFPLYSTHIEKLTYAAHLRSIREKEKETKGENNQPVSSTFFAVYKEEKSIDLSVPDGPSLSNQASSSNARRLEPS